MPVLEQHGELFLLELDHDDENRFTLPWLAEVEDAITTVEKATGPRALVTVGDGKFWSTGLDLDWLRSHPDQQATYLARVHALFARWLAAPFVTVAAINGHAFAAGAMWALSHDVRVMRADRGYVCLPEIDLRLSFQPAMARLITARLSPAVAHEAMTTGRRYGGDAARTAGIVDAAEPAETVREQAIDRARQLARTSSTTLGDIKETLYRDTLTALAAPVDPVDLAPAPERVTSARAESPLWTLTLVEDEGRSP